MRKSVRTSVEPERAARGAFDVCSASIDGGPVCCKRSHLPVQPVKLRDDQLRATESPADPVLDAVNSFARGGPRASTTSTHRPLPQPETKAPQRSRQQLGD